jgi:hypothetical protein
MTTDIVQMIEDAASFHHDRDMARRLAVNISFQDKQREALILAANEIRRLREELARHGGRHHCAT